MRVCAYVRVCVCVCVCDGVCCLVYEELTGAVQSSRARDDELSSLQYEAFTIQRSELADLEHIGEGK